MTICVKDRVDYFGEIVNQEMRLNQWGEIVNNQWLWLAEHYPYIGLGPYAIMPNHFHAIIEIRGRGVVTPGPYGGTIILALSQQRGRPKLNPYPN